MAPITRPSHLINPTASSLQLETSASHVDGVPRAVEDSIRYETSRLIQVAGILLRLPQEAIAQAIVILQRFFIGPDAASLVEIDAWVSVCGYIGYGYQRHDELTTVSN